MVAVLPVAGAGTRLRPHTHTLPKVLIQVAGKPILGHILDEIEKLGIEELILIIGYMGEKIIKYVEENYHFRMHYVEQKERRGIGHAIYLTKDFLPRDPILIVLGDTVFKADLRKMISQPYSSLAVKAVTNPSRFGNVELEGGFIKQLVEKPTHPATNLAVVGIYYLTNISLLIESLGKIIQQDIRTGNEYQLTDALQLMINQGEKIKAFEVEGWYDCGRPETLLLTNRYLLEEKGGTPQREGCIIIPPTFIAESSIVEQSIIGPYVSIAGGVIISASVIQNSIINENARVERVLLSSSIIGEHAVVIGKFQQLNVGDSSEISFIE